MTRHYVEDYEAVTGLSRQPDDEPAEVVGETTPLVVDQGAPQAETKVVTPPDSTGQIPSGVQVETA